MKNLIVGSFVVHRNMPERGVGKVICVSDRYVRVIFIDDHGIGYDMRPDKAYVDAVSAPDDVTRFGRFDVRSTSDCKSVEKPPPPAEWTFEQAHERFLKHYPGGLSSDEYVTAEREWKASQLPLWNQLFRPDDLRTLTAKDPLLAGDLVMQVAATRGTALLSHQAELPRLGWALRKGAPAPFLLALADLVESPTPTRVHFEALVDALESIPTARPATKLLSWPVLTVVPFLVRPDSHMFLKPQVTKETARKLGVDLFYDARPSWHCYERLLAWSHQLLEQLRPHGARDMIDVQSFIWTIGHPSA